MAPGFPVAEIARIPDSLHYSPEPYPKFAHSSEELVAKFLDKCGLVWEYEPRMFEFGYTGNGEVTGFRPDFYIPEAEAYLEVAIGPTILKNRKLIKLESMKIFFPGVKVIYGVINEKDKKMSILDGYSGDYEIPHLKEISLNGNWEGCPEFMEYLSERTGKELYLPAMSEAA